MELSGSGVLLMKVLIACEESQRVCTAFRERGHEAYSCDIQECSGGHPEWHICGNALGLINGHCGFFTEDGTYHSVDGSGTCLLPIRRVHIFQELQHVICH